MTTPDLIGYNTESVLGFQIPTDDDDSTHITGRNSLVFLVYAGKEMYIKHGKEEKKFITMSIECCRNALLSICRKQRNDLVSIVLFGTKSLEGLFAPEHTVLLLPLGEPAVSKIKKLNAIIEDDCQELIDKYGVSDEYDLSQALHYCESLIYKSKVKSHVKNLVLMTCLDNPKPRSQEFGHKARKQAEVLFDHRVDLDVIGLGDFNSSLFYKELVVTSKGEVLSDWKDRDPILKIDQLIEQIDRITEKFTRRLSYLHLHKDYKIYIALYKLYTEPKKFYPKRVTEAVEKINLNSEEIQDLAFEAETEQAEFEEPFAPQADRSEYLGSLVMNPFVGGAHISVTRSELKSLLPVKVRGLDIIGFIKTRDVPLYYSVGEPYLVVPYSNVKNNRLVFAHLLNRCLVKGMSIMCWFTLTKASSPVSVILHPTEASEYAKGREHSSGFIMSKLPYADMILEPDEMEELGKPSQEQLEAAVGILSKTTIPYTVDMFCDIEVKNRVDMIEAIALDYEEELPENVCDTDIDLEELTERLGSLNGQFMNCREVVSSGSKRSSSSVSSGATLPKQQKTKQDPLVMVKNGLAEKLSVAELRTLLKGEGVKSLSAMNKPLLVSIATKRFCNI